jgi:hypothetical protein
LAIVVLELLFATSFIVAPARDDLMQKSFLRVTAGKAQGKSPDETEKNEFQHQIGL